LAFASLGSAQSRQRLDNGWEFYQGQIGWHLGNLGAATGTDNVTWASRSRSPLFQCRDSVDPDAHYYQGPGWYRTRLKGGESISKRRTCALRRRGTKIAVFSEWKSRRACRRLRRMTVDVTTRLLAPLRQFIFRGDARAVLCDNSRNAEMIP